MVFFVLKLKQIKKQKAMKHLNLIFAVLFSLYVISCKKDAPDLIKPSQTLIELEGEGGVTEISFNNGNWRIAGVVNMNGDVNISGDTYTVDSVLIKHNYQLKLDGLGRAESSWVHKGFSILRNTPATLEIFVKENRTGEEFGFFIYLESENHSQKIIVKQKPSQGYSVKEIKYSISKEDGDSFFMKHSMTISYNYSSPQSITFLPFSGLEPGKVSFFESDDIDAFIWTDNNPEIMVKTPVEIDGDKVIIGFDTALYSGKQTVRDNDYKFDTETTLEIPEGYSKYSVEIEMRKRIVSYTLDLTNNRTGEEKTVHGKWIETAPSGNFEINRVE